MNWKLILLSLAVIGILALIGLYSMGVSFGRGIQGFQSGPVPAVNTFTMYYADWCPHCRNAKPIWEDEKAKYADTLVNNYKVVFVNVDCSDDADPHTQALIQEYNIKGFPTLKMVYSKEDGTPLTVDFDAKITKYSLDQFIETVLNQSS